MKRKDDLSTILKSIWFCYKEKSLKDTYQITILVKWVCLYCIIALPYTYSTFKSSNLMLILTVVSLWYSLDFKDDIIFETCSAFKEADVNEDGYISVDEYTREKTWKFKNISFKFEALKKFKRELWLWKGLGAGGVHRIFFAFT